MQQHHTRAEAKYVKITTTWCVFFKYSFINDHCHEKFAFSWKFKELK